MSDLSELMARVMERLAPPPDVSGSEWAEAHRRLSPESAAEPGRFRMSRTPYMREILDVMTGSEVEVEEVWIKKSAQIGYSETLNNALGYHMHLDPGPIMMVQPTLEMAESYSKDRIEPMLRDVAVLSQVTDFREKRSANTILRKRFPGGMLQLIGANSPAAIASRPIRVVVCDEVDRYPHSTGKEGDPIELARARQATFEGTRMFVGGGTPSLKGGSRICKGYDTTDQRLYMVPCPHCGEYIALEWERLERERGAHYGQYQCQSCDLWIQHHQKAGMLAGGHWEPSNEAAPNVRGYFVWAGYSPFRSWEWICNQWHQAQGDPELEQVMCNTVLGREYSWARAEVDGVELFRSRESYEQMPKDVIVVTAGVDTQDDRFEVEVVGWGRGEESWSLDYRTIDGDPANSETRRALESYLVDSRWEREDGRQLHVKAVFIDAGGHRADAVYSFVRGKAARHVYACRGLTTPGQPVFARFSRIKRAKIRLAHVGTDTAKETILARLANPEEVTGRMHFPMTYALEYFRGLISEEKRIRWAGGQPRVYYEKIPGAGRNEPLDCRVYSLAALRSLPLNLRQRRSARRQPKPAPKEPKREKRAKVPAPGTRRRPRKRGWISPR